MLNTCAMSVAGVLSATAPNPRFETTATRAPEVTVSSNTLRPSIAARRSDGVRVQSSASARHGAFGRPTPRTVHIAPLSTLEKMVVSEPAMIANGASPKLWSVQVDPSGDVMIAKSPTATNMPLNQMMSRSRVGVDELWIGELIRSGERMISPVLMSPMNALPDDASSLISFVVGEVRWVDTIPSGGVRIVPCNPPATYWRCAQMTTSRSSVVGEFRVVHEMPSGDVMIVPP